MTIEEILNDVNLSIEEKILALKEKTIAVPVWNGVKGLESEYNPAKHPVMDKKKYPDIVTPEGIEEVTRVPIDLQRLAVKRMTELVCGVPVRRVYKPENEKQKEIAGFIESVLDRNRIDSVNIERCNMLFACCEFMTLWYGVEEKNTLYGRESDIKLRCKNYSPMVGDELFPLFDEYGDMVAMSIGYNRKKGKKNVRYFDTYTATKHYKWGKENSEWEELENENITLDKIPAVYAHRPTPIWEGTSNLVSEMEWALSRNGNYLRQNSKPLFIVFADQQIRYGDEKSPNSEFRSVMQYPKGSTAGYVTWSQAVENLKFFVEQLRSMFFTQLQLPDWSYDKMSQQALSGESRKQMFIDAQLKVKDESGRLLETFDREINILKAFAKTIFNEPYYADIDALKIETIITPFQIEDDKDTISNLVLANGNKPIMSQRESIELYGHSDDVDKTLKEIQDEEMLDVLEPTI